MTRAPRLARKVQTTAASRLMPLPSELEHAMQGLAYWLGYRAAYDDTHNAYEGAIVGELAALLKAQLGATSHVKVRLEHPVHELTGKRPPQNGRPPAVDVAVGTHSENSGDTLDEVHYVVEVKRSGQYLYGDLVRLAHTRAAAKKAWRAFALVVGEPPSGFLDAGQKATRRQQTATARSHTARFHVRRVCKAHARLEAKADSGHWVCAVEVLA